MKANAVAGLVLAVVGLGNILYGFYRVVALDKSLIPLVPVGLMCTALGLIILVKAKSSSND